MKITSKNLTKRIKVAPQYFINHISGSLKKSQLEGFSLVSNMNNDIIFILFSSLFSECSNSNFHVLHFRENVQGKHSIYAARTPIKMR